MTNYSSLSISTSRSRDEVTYFVNLQSVMRHQSFSDCSITIQNRLPGDRTESEDERSYITNKRLMHRTLF